MGTKQQQEGKQGAECRCCPHAKPFTWGSQSPEEGTPLWKLPFLGGPDAAGVGLIPLQVPPTSAIL